MVQIVVLPLGNWTQDSGLVSFLAWFQRMPLEEDGQVGRYAVLAVAGQNGTKDQASYP